LIRGRMFTAADRRETPKVVLINEAAARQFYPNQDPIGKPIGIGMGGFGERVEIVGIIGDVRFGNVDELPKPDVFVSYGQSPRRAGILFIRTTAAPSSI